MDNDAKVDASVPVAIDRETKSAQAIARLEAGATIAPIIPRTVDEVFRIAQAVILADMAPAGFEMKVSGQDRPDPQKIAIAIMKGAEVGIPPITALSTICIINKRPCIWGDGAVALVQRSGRVEKVEESWEGEAEKVGAPVQTDRGEQDYTPQHTDFPDTLTAVYRIWRRGQAAPYEGRFSVRDARRAGLWANPKKKPWVEYPKRMLRARARAFALRDGFADCLMGLSIAEEIQDLPEAPPEIADTSFLDDGPPEVAPTETESAAEL